jgi:hypothetical protein
MWAVDGDNHTLSSSAFGEVEPERAAVLRERNQTSLFSSAGSTECKSSNAAVSITNGVVGPAWARGGGGGDDGGTQLKAFARSIFSIICPGAA